MAISFDGEDLRIILDSTTTVDAGTIYSRWKDWMKTGNNARYPAAFTSEGGAPVVGATDQASYLRLNNTAGWRIRPPEANITIYVTGNLIPADSTLPLVAPTIGGYTVLIVGLQPIAQNVERVAGLVWQEQHADHASIAGSAAELAELTYGLLGANADHNNLSFDADGRMTSAKIIAYEDSSLTTAIGAWLFTATYDGDGKLATLTRKETTP